MSQPGYSYTLPLTDAAQVNVTARSFCNQIIVWEMPSASGWPRNFLVLLPIGGGSQLSVLKSSKYIFYGPFAPGDVAGTLELASAGGDSSTFAVAEVQAKI